MREPVCAITRGIEPAHLVLAFRGACGASAVHWFLMKLEKLSKTVRFLFQMQLFKQHGATLYTRKSLP